MKDFTSFIKSIRDKLHDPLPGEAAQLEMAPVTRARMMSQGVDLNEAKKAAVLILLYPEAGIKTVLIQRQDYDGIHSNQVSFPGGQFEAGDDSLQHTALRETCEEIGICQEDIRILGNLSQLYIPPSNFNVLPVLGYMNKPPSFKPDIQEVKKVIPVPLHALSDKKNRSVREIETSYQKRVNVPCYMIDGHIVWGATAMIINELLAVIES